MKKSKRKLGHAFWKLASASPTFMEDVELLKAAGIRIRLLNKSDIAYFDGAKRIIYVGKWSSHVNIIVSIGHEYVHALLRPTTDVKDGDDRETWINERLDEETTAIVHELQIIRELLDAGKRKHFGKMFSEVGLNWLTIFNGGDFAADVVAARFVAMELDPPDESLLKVVRAGGFDAVRAVLCHTTTSTNQLLYPDWYGSWFDQNMRRIERNKKRAAAIQAKQEEDTKAS